jgi:uncharacterized RDD family membrane protein YckC
VPADPNAAAYRRARFYERWAATFLDVALIAVVTVLSLLVAQLVAWVPFVGGLLGALAYMLLPALAAIGLALTISEERATSRQSWGMRRLRIALVSTRTGGPIGVTANRWRDRVRLLNVLLGQVPGYIVRGDKLYDRGIGIAVIKLPPDGRLPSGALPHLAPRGALDIGPDQFLE